MEKGELDKVFAAGVFEGEGCIAVSYNYIAIVLSMTDFEIPQWLQSIWGGGVSKHISKVERYKPSLTWRLNGLNSRQFLLDIQPYLKTARRKATVEAALLWLTMSKKGMGRVGYSDEIKLARAACYHRITELNSNSRVNNLENSQISS